MRPKVRASLQTLEDNLTLVGGEASQAGWAWPAEEQSRSANTCFRMKTGDRAGLSVKGSWRRIVRKESWGGGRGKCACRLSCEGLLEEVERCPRCSGAPDSLVRKAGGNRGHPCWEGRNETDKYDCLPGKFRGIDKKAARTS